MGFRHRRPSHAFCHGIHSDSLLLHYFCVKLLGSLALTFCIRPKLRTQSSGHLLLHISTIYSRPFKNTFQIHWKIITDPKRANVHVHFIAVNMHSLFIFTFLLLTLPVRLTSLVFSSEPSINWMINCVMIPFFCVYFLPPRVLAWPTYISLATSSGLAWLIDLKGPYVVVFCLLGHLLKSSRTLILTDIGFPF